MPKLASQRFLVGYNSPRHATRRTVHGASRLVRAINVLLVGENPMCCSVPALYVGTPASMAVRLRTGMTISTPPPLFSLAFLGPKLKICPTGQNDKKPYTGDFLPAYGTKHGNQEIRVPQTQVRSRFLSRYTVSGKCQCSVEVTKMTKNGIPVYFCQITVEKNKTR